MTRPVTGIAVAFVGAMCALFLGGGTIPGCLGPLNVTAVQCAAHSGRLPTEGPLIGMIVAALALGLLVATWSGRPSRRDAYAGVAGLALGAAAYLVRRPAALQGPDFDGSWLSLPLPLEPVTLLWWTLAGAITAFAVLSAVRLLRVRAA